MKKPFDEALQDLIDAYVAQGTGHAEIGQIINRFAMKPAGFDLIAHLRRQQAFSFATFGPPNGVAGVIDHIRKELVEIEMEPHDLEEWTDVLILGADGALRAGHSPEAIVDMWVYKQTKNEGRKWPDWRTAEPGKAIEHIREGE